MTGSGASSATACPASGTTTQRAPGMAAAIASPSPVRRSPPPATTSVGAAISDSLSAARSGPRAQPGRAARERGRGHPGDRLGEPAQRALAGPFVGEQRAREEPRQQRPRERRGGDLGGQAAPAVDHRQQARARLDEGRHQGEGAHALGVGERQLDGDGRAQARADDVGGRLAHRRGVRRRLRHVVALLLGGVGEADAARVHAQDAVASRRARGPAARRPRRPRRSPAAAAPGRPRPARGTSSDTPVGHRDERRAGRGPRLDVRLRHPTAGAGSRRRATGRRRACARGPGRPGATGARPRGARGLGRRGRSHRGDRRRGSARRLRRSAVLAREGVGVEGLVRRVGEGARAASRRGRSRPPPRRCVGRSPPPSPRSRPRPSPIR